MRPFIVEEFVEIPANVEVKIEGNELIVKGPKGENRRKFEYPKVYIEVKKDERKIRIYSYFPTRRELRILYTWKAHIQNMIEGVTKGFVYKLKAVYVHFPFKMKIQGNKFIIENFLGEKAPRVTEIPPDVKVKIEGEYVIVESHDIEKAGNFAGRLEQLTRVKEKDRRKFQDGLYIVEKP